MKILTIFSLLALGWTSTSAMALTVNKGSIENKTRATSLQTVDFEGAPALVLTDAAGMSLYTFDADSPGQSVCQDRCLSVWPPLNVADDEVILPPFGKIMGNNGKPQLTLEGLPLYYYVKDRMPGDIRGHYPSWQLIFVTE